MNAFDLHDLLTEARRYRLAPDTVVEIHVAPDDDDAPGTISYAGITSVERFLDDWGYSMDDCDDPPAGKRWLGVVHQEGAYIAALP